MVHGLQAVRPVHGRRHPGVDRLDRRQEVARLHVLWAEDLAPLEVEPREVLRERPVGPVAAQRGLPHVAVRVDHAGHDDASRRVDLERSVGGLQVRPHAGDALVDDEHVRVVEDLVRIVHRQHLCSAQDERTAVLGRRGTGAHDCAPSGGAFNVVVHVTGPAPSSRGARTPHRRVGGLSRAAQAVSGALGTERKEASTRCAQGDFPTVSCPTPRMSTTMELVSVRAAICA
jgi:hypothetical protein